MPQLPTVRSSSVGALLHFNRGTYRFPDYPSVLVFHLKTPDTLCADRFVEVMERKLCLPTSWINLSNHEDILYHEVRDRYWLSQKYTLVNPPADKCYACKHYLEDSDVHVVVKCCQMTFHRRCINGQNKRSYCKEPWLFFNCCVCKQECAPIRQQWLDSRHTARIGCPAIQQTCI